jgi:proline iminopeptidase
MKRLLSLIATVVTLSLLLASCATILPVRDRTGNIVPDSVAEITTVTVDGVDNWTTVRGRSVHNPVLLILHGGPGSPELPLFRHFNGELEDSFIVAYWEQPGTCKSYSDDLPESAVTIDKLVDYAKGVIDYLRVRFGKDKVYLVGHSWGSILALRIAERYPELLYAVIGVGQVISVVDGEVKSYRQTLERAREHKNERAIRELEAMGDPPSYVRLGGNWYDDFMTKRKWTLYFGLALYGQASYRHFERYYFEAPEYTIFDLPKYVKGRRFTTRALARDLLAVDLTTQAEKIDVPVYFFMGKYDAISSTSLFDDYVKNLKAPKKEVVRFEHSAHFVPFEEPDRFNAEVIRVMRETGGDAGLSAPPQ